MKLVSYYLCGRLIGYCDARCYNGKNGSCSCICGGENHGIGLDKALANVRTMHGNWMKQAKKKHGKRYCFKINREVWQPSLPFED